MKMTINNILKSVDLFGSSVIININGKMKYTTSLGGLFTLTLIGVFAFFTYFFGKDMFHKQNPKLINYRSYLNDNSTLINNTNFFFAIQLQYPNKTIVKFNETGYSPYFTMQALSESFDARDPLNLKDVNLPIEKCKLEYVDFFEIDQSLKDEIIENFVCVKVNNILLRGSPFHDLETHQLRIHFNFMYGKLKKDFSIISDLMFYSKKIFPLNLRMFYQAYSYNADDFANPIVKKLAYSEIKLVYDSLTHIYGSFVRARSVKDDSFLLRTNDTDYLYGFSDFKVVAKNAILIDSLPLCELGKIIFYLEYFEENYFRSYMKIQDVAAQVMSIVRSFILTYQFLIFFYTKDRICDQLAHNFYKYIPERTVRSFYDYSFREKGDLKYGPQTFSNEEGQPRQITENYEYSNNLGYSAREGNFNINSNLSNVNNYNYDPPQSSRVKFSHADNHSILDIDKSEVVSNQRGSNELQDLNESNTKRINTNQNHKSKLYASTSTLPKIFLNSIFYDRGREEDKKYLDEKIEKRRKGIKVNFGSIQFRRISKMGYNKRFSAIKVKNIRKMNYSLNAGNSILRRKNGISSCELINVNNNLYEQPQHHLLKQSHNIQNIENNKNLISEFKITSSPTPSNPITQKTLPTKDVTVNTNQNLNKSIRSSKEKSKAKPLVIESSLRTQQGNKNIQIVAGAKKRISFKVNNDQTYIIGGDDEIKNNAKTNANNAIKKFSEEGILKLDGKLGLMDKIFGLFNCKSQMSEELKTKLEFYDKANQKIREKLDISYFLTLFEEFQKFKILFLNPYQSLSLRYSKKPNIFNVNLTNVIDYYERFCNSNNHSDNINKIMDYFTEKIKNKTLDMMDQKILEIIDGDLKKAILMSV
jgi:hypothetical protein